MLTDLNVVQKYYEQQRATALQTANNVVRQWRARDKDVPYWDGFNLALPALADAVTQGQYEATTRAAEFMPLVLEAQGASLKEEMNPAGYLSPTGYVEYGLAAAPAKALEARSKGASEAYMDAYTAFMLNRFTRTLVEDAGREAVLGQSLVEPSITYYYRKLQTPSCNRCAILVGRPYRKDASFLRHPQCDCQSIPSVDRDPTEDFNLKEAIRKGSVTGFNKEEIDAIVNQGADINQITNAKRSKMGSADLFGKKVQTRTEGTTVRGLAGQRLKAKYGAEKVKDNRYRVSRVPRLTPKEIYRQADNQTQLMEMMRLHGYVL